MTTKIFYFSTQIFKKINRQGEIMKRWLSIIITVLVAFTIFYVSDLSSPPGSGTSYLPIFYHTFIFFLLSLFLFISVKGKMQIKTGHILIVLLISIIYALSDEFHQLFVPGRTAALEDVLLDTAGIFSATLIYAGLNLNKKKSSN